MDKLTGLEKTTLGALDSFNPFNTPPKEPLKNGIPISQAEEPAKRKPGRPRQNPLPDPVAPKRGPGRPPKAVAIEQEAEPVLGEIEVPVQENPIKMTLDNNGSPNYRAEWPGRDVFVGFHCNFETNVNTAFALIALALDFGKDKIRFDFATDPDPNEAKNQLVALFLQTDAPWMLMVGNDIVPAIGRAPFTRRKLGLPPSVQENVINRHALHRLIGSGRDLIGASYFGKLAGSGVANSHRDGAALTRQSADIIHAVEWAGTGLLLVHRRVFAGIAATTTEAPFQGGDKVFCEKAKNAGFQAFVDFGIPAYNIGRQAFGG